MKSADAKLNLQTFFQRSRDHLLQESPMKNILFVLSSPSGWNSYSHQFASHIVDDLKARHPGAKVVARGGVYSEGPAQQFDFQEPYLRAVLGFIGITNVRAVRVEGMAMGEQALKNAMASAKAQSEKLVCEFAQLDGSPDTTLSGALA